MAEMKPHYLPYKFQTDEHIMLAAVKHNCHAFINAHECIRNNPQILLAAMERKCSMLSYAGKELMQLVGHLKHVSNPVQVFKSMIEQKQLHALIETFDFDNTSPAQPKKARS